jgi:gamma-glutamylcyclotransferase (GGCT)/AIG2-like uncharacterized protein YtfP
MKVFVYGTLKPGEENYPRYCEGKVKKSQRAFTFGKLFDLPQGYPAMTTGNDQVHGYLLEFNQDQVLANLDELEDYHPSRIESENLYQRVEQEIFALEDITAKPPQQNISLGLAWVYIMSEIQVMNMQGRLLPNGWWSW